MTDMELFEIVKNHLLTQNAQSMRISGCAYRGYGGMKCAAGVLIKDEHYNPGIEGDIITEMGPRMALILSGVQERQIPIVRKLQCIHDDVPDICSWPRLLENLRQQILLTE